MPELPEVERGRRLAESVAVGRRIEHVWCADDGIVFEVVAPRAWSRALEGKRVEAARRWGKQLWLDLSAPPHPLFHFGMTGGFRTPEAGPLQLKSGPREEPAAWPPRFAKIRMRFDDGGELVTLYARSGAEYSTISWRDYIALRDVLLDRGHGLTDLAAFVRTFSTVGGGEFPEVIPIVVYNGAEPWDGP